MLCQVKTKTLCASLDAVCCAALGFSLVATTVAKTRWEILAISFHVALESWGFAFCLELAQRCSRLSAAVLSESFHGPRESTHNFRVPLVDICGFRDIILQIVELPLRPFRLRFDSARLCEAAGTELGNEFPWPVSNRQDTSG